MSNLSSAQKIEQTKSNLPLPDQPPNSSDFNSADGRATNVGSGGLSGDISRGDGSTSGLRGPATGDSSVRADGSHGESIASIDAGRTRAGEKLPSDAVAGKHANTADTTNPDYGYPTKNDPAGSFDAKVSGRGNPPTAD